MIVLTQFVLIAIIIIVALNLAAYVNASVKSPSQTSLVEEFIWTLRFTHGVASGDVTSESAILWTRVNQEATIKVEVSADPEFRNVNFVQKINTNSEDDFTAKALATGLEPNQIYYYRWSQGTIFSEMGSFKTAPKSIASGVTHFSWVGGTRLDNLNGSRAFGDEKLVNAVKQEKKIGLDFLLYLGDSLQPKTGLEIENHGSLEDFRNFYRDSRQLESFYELLRITSAYVLGDGLGLVKHHKGHTTNPDSYKSASKSFYEYMPVRSVPTKETESGCIGSPQFRTLTWDRYTELFLLDTVSCMSPSVEDICHEDPAPTLPSFVRIRYANLLRTQPPEGCLDSINDSTRTLLGTTQKELLKESLLRSTAKYKFIISPVPIQQLFIYPYQNWEGYSAERLEILQFIKDNNIKGIIFLSSDSRLSMANEVVIDRYTDPTPVAYEFIAGPIASNWDKNNRYDVSNIRSNVSDSILASLNPDCLVPNKESYGSVEIDRGTGIAKVMLKYENAHRTQNQTSFMIPCEKPFDLRSISNPLSSNSTASDELLNKHNDGSTRQPSNSLPFSFPLPL